MVFDTLHLSTSLLAALALLTAPCALADQLLTDPTAFASALPGPASTLTFDSFSPGTSIASGAAIGGITFTYDSDLPMFQVVDNFDTTSGANSLGDNDPGNYNQLVAGDGFTMTFAATRALGLYFVTSADPLYQGDIELVTPHSTALNSATPNFTLPDTGTVYFVGVIANAPFTSATVQFNSGAVGAFFYNVDDITTSPAAGVPEPSTFFLAGAALLSLALIRRRFRT